MDIAGRRILLLVPMLAMIIDLGLLTAFLLTQVGQSHCHWGSTTAGRVATMHRVDRHHHHHHRRHF